MGICLLVQTGVLVQVATYVMVFLLLDVCVEWEVEEVEEEGL